MFQSLEIFHIGALVLLALTTISFLRVAWQKRNSIWGEILDRALILSAALAWLLFAMHNFFGSFQFPLNIADITGFLAPLAIATKRWQFRSLLYLWGIGLCTQGLFTPLVSASPFHIDFWFYWPARGAIVLCAAYDLIINRYRPGWRDFTWTCLITWAYVGIVLPIDLLQHANYGYLGDTDHGMRPMMLALGPWPQRILIAVVFTVILFLVLTLPWILLSRQHRTPLAPLLPEIEEDYELIYST